MILPSLNEVYQPSKKRIGEKKCRKAREKVSKPIGNTAQTVKGSAALLSRDKGGKRFESNKSQEIKSHSILPLH